MTTLLLVASSGGHLDELRLMVGVLGLEYADKVWVTAPTAHTESVLVGETVYWVPPVESRQLGAALRAVPLARRLHRRVAPDLVVSTGAALAFPHLAVARLAGCETWYVESVTRHDGPSLTGRLAAALPGLRTMAQGFESSGWERVDDVFSRFQVDIVERKNPPSSLLVTLGQEQFPFDRAVEAVLRTTGELTVKWQLGTTVKSMPDARTWVPGLQLRREAGASDIIVCHAGVGSILMALSAGKVPVVLPRSGARGEHVDDHQVALARELEAKGLVVVADPDTLTPGHLLEAFRYQVTPMLDPARPCAA